MRNLSRARWFGSDTNSHQLAKQPDGQIVAKAAQPAGQLSKKRFLTCTQATINYLVIVEFRTRPVCGFTTQIDDTESSKIQIPSRMTPARTKTGSVGRTIGRRNTPSEQKDPDPIVKLQELRLLYFIFYVPCSFCLDVHVATSSSRQKRREAHKNHKIQFP
jgi:hypothetical protein